MNDTVTRVLAEALDRAHDDIRVLRSRLGESILVALGGDTESEMVEAGVAAASVLHRPVTVTINGRRIECNPSQAVTKS